MSRGCVRVRHGLDRRRTDRRQGMRPTRDFLHTRVRSWRMHWAQHARGLGRCRETRRRRCLGSRWSTRRTGTRAHNAEFRECRIIISIHHSSRHNSATMYCVSSSRRDSHIFGDPYSSGYNIITLVPEKCMCTTCGLQSSTQCLTKPSWASYMLSSSFCTSCSSPSRESCCGTHTNPHGQAPIEDWCVLWFTYY